MSSLIATRNGQVGIINPDSGIFEPIISDRIENLTDIAVALDGRIFAITFNTLYNIDETTGEVVELGQFGNGASINAIGFSPEDKLFGVSTQGSEIYEIDTTTGASTVVFDIGNGFRSSGDIEFDDRSGRFFATSTSPVSDTLYSIGLNRQTGELSQADEIGPIGFQDVWGLSSNENGLLGYTRDRQEIRIDELTGMGRFVRTVTGVSTEIAGAAELPGNDAPPDTGGNIFDQIEVSISSPSSILPNSADEVTVTYRNVGDTDVPAPLLSLKVENALLKVAGESDFTESQVQFLGVNKQGVAGVLPPGESNRFTVQFQPSSSGNAPINFSVSTVDDATVIDWESLRDRSRPDYIPDDAWQRIYDNFLTEVGTTASDYRQLLTENANYLSQLGHYVSNTDTLLAFEFQQASSFQALSQQYSVGSFGSGRPFVGDTRLTVDAEGNVAIDNAGTRRAFEQLADGSYRGQTGDFATLSVDSAGVYFLKEQDGTAIAFNPTGQLNTIEDPNGNSITALYENASEPSLVTSLVDSFGNGLTFTYNNLSRIESVADSDGRMTTYAYDATGNNLLSATDESGTTTYEYDVTKVSAITDPNGNRLEFVYDERERLVQQRLTTSGAQAEVVNYSYDSAGGVTVTDAEGNETRLLLNEDGQIGQLTDANGRSVGFSYDAQGNLIQLVAPENNTSLFSYDAQGNLTTQIDPLDQKTEFTYSSTFNQLTSVTDPRGNGMVYDYDAQGNLAEILYADGSKETFEYSDRGEVKVSINRRGQQITFDYNERGQLISQQNPDDSVPTQYVYDAQGNLDTVTDDTGTIDLDYDAAGRLTKITYPSGRSLAYEYDAGDRRTSLTDQDGNRTNYTYDEVDRLSKLIDSAGNLIVSYRYDTAGRLLREDKGNGTYTLYTYDSADQLLSIINHAPDNNINSSAIYTYDNLGRQSSQTTLEGSWTYSYDAIGQLTVAEFASATSDIPNQSLTYEYDAAGNRVRTIENGLTTSYTANNLNQYTEVNGFDYQYDADGNLKSTTDPSKTSLYSYDSEDRLVSVIEPNGTVTAYEYDAFGNRSAAARDGQRTEYLIDPFGFGDIVGEYDDTGNLISSYTHGLGLESSSNSGSNFYYDFNAIGSTISLTNDEGSVVNSYFYSPFGKDLIEKETVVNSFEFIGQYGVVEEPNGLELMRARFYDSSLGRFISADPTGLSGEDTNLYRYANNSPNDYIDPEGKIPFLVPVSIGLINSAYGYYDARRNNQPYSFRDFAGDFASGAIGAGTLKVAKGVAALSGLNLTRKQRALTAVLGGIYGDIVGSIFKGNADELRPDGLDIAIDALFGSTGLGLDRLVGSYLGPRLKDLIKKELQAAIERGDNTGIPNTDLLNFPGTRVSATETQYFIPVDSFPVPNKPDNQARSKGEPHLTTFDGVGYDFQGAGDFTLVASANGDRNIQVRYVQIDSRVTVASAIATEVDGQNVVIDSEGIEFIVDPNNPDISIPQVTRSLSGQGAKVTVDGVDVEIASGGSIDVGNGRIYRSSGNEYTVVYAGEDGIINDGDDQLVVNYFRPGTINIVDVYLGDEKKDQITGLLGNLNNNPDDDIALADGTPLDLTLPFDQLYGPYREDWRIKDIADSLFSYEAGQGPDTFYNPNFPTAKFTFDDLNPADRARGEAAAIAAGYKPGTFAFESAAFDFAVTGEEGFLEGAQTDPGASLDVDSRTSSLQGIVFQDLNGNGIRDSELVQGESPDIVFAIDVSGSANDRFDGTPVKDVNNDGRENTILDAELASFIQLNQQLIAQGLGNNVDVGIVAFGDRGVQVDLDPTLEGIQLAANPNTDRDLNGTSDVEDVLRSVGTGAFRAGSGTNFEDALQAVEKTFVSLGTQPGEGNLIFLSDGKDNSTRITDEVQRLNDLGINLSAFGVGQNASLDSLRAIDPNADMFTSTDELLGVFSDLEGGESQNILDPGVDGITVYIDTNSNGALDARELSQITNEMGQYSFDSLSAGTYTLRELVPNGLIQTAPENGAITIELGIGRTIGDLNFGNTLESSLVATDTVAGL